jgi:hypothetical protein
MLLRAHEQTVDNLLWSSFAHGKPECTSTIFLITPVTSQCPLQVVAQGSCPFRLSLRLALLGDKRSAARHNHFIAKERDPSTHRIGVRVGCTASLNVVLKKKSLAPLGDQNLMYNKQRNIIKLIITNKCTTCILSSL